MNIWGGWTQLGLAYAAFVILVFLTFRRLIMGIIRPGVKYQPSDPAAGIDIFLIIFWTFFTSGFYSLDIIPATVKDIVALVTLFFIMWCMWEVLHDMGIKIIALIITAYIILILGTLSKSNWQVMTMLTTASSFVLNFENTRLLVKKMGITIKYSERNRQTVVLAQFCVFIANIFLVLFITFTESMATWLGKPLTFWLYDWINQWTGEKSTQNINYHTFFPIVMDRMIIIAFLALCLLVIVVLFRNKLRESWEQCKNFIKTKLDMEPSSTTSDTTSLDDASTTHVTQVEEEKQD